VPEHGWLTYGKVSGRADEVLTDLAIDVHGDTPRLRDTGAENRRGLVLDSVPLPEPGASTAWTLVAVALGVVVLVGVGVAVRHLDH
jgi:hypothetical protein